MTTKLQEVDLNEVICAKEEYLICVEGKGKSPCFGGEIDFLWIFFLAITSRMTGDFSF